MMIGIKQTWLLVLVLTLLLPSVLAIDQLCPCPTNAHCLSNSSMCGCNSGFIGDCNVTAIPVSLTETQVHLVQGQKMLFVVTPDEVGHYIEFTFTLCLHEPLQLTLNLYGETGTTTAYNQDNMLVNPVSGEFSSGCQELATPYISFGTQPNGENDMLILGMEATAESAEIEISVDQEEIIGVFLYYYILIAITLVVGLIIAIGVGVFVYRQRIRRGRNSPAQPVITRRNQYNNVAHFQNLMPMFPAEQLASDGNTCSICLQQIEAAEVVRKTPCSHIFHSTCIDAWGMKNLTCPVCRCDLSLLAFTNGANSANNSGNTSGGRIRNSSIRMQVPPEQDDWEYPRVNGGTMQAEQSSTPPNALLDSPNVEIRENML